MAPAIEIGPSATQVTLWAADREMRDIFQFTLKKHELSLCSLGFFEHSQPGGGGGGEFDSAPSP